MSFWKIALSVIGGVLIFVYAMNFITNGFEDNSSMEAVTPSMFLSLTHFGGHAKHVLY